LLFAIARHKRYREKKKENNSLEFQGLHERLRSHSCYFWPPPPQKSLPTLHLRAWISVQIQWYIR
jgi:hypothetical protein